MRSSKIATVLACLLLVVPTACTRVDEREPRHVVIVVLDTLGADHVGAYGYERDTTPNFDRVASEGTLFEHAYTPQVWTMTAMLSMFTGLYPNAHGAARSRAASPGATTMTEIIKEHGFATAAFTGIGGWAGAKYGLGRGFDVFRVGRSDARRDNPPRFQWLEEQAKLAADDPNHRFFLLAHYYDVHSDFGTDVPYNSPEPYLTRYLPGGLKWARSGATGLLFKMQKQGDVNDEDRRVLSALYDGGVRFTDEHALGPLLDKLRELDLYEDTLLVITADHGEELFEHGKCCHLQPYDETARVPLVMRGPGVPRGKRVSEMVQLNDLTPTILARLGLEPPAKSQGRDLSPLLRGRRGAGREAVYVDGIFGAIPPYKFHEPSRVMAEIDGRRWSFVSTVDERVADGRRVFETRGPGMLFDYDRDPQQTKDLAAEEPELAARLEEMLLAWYDENEELAHGLGHSEVRESMLSEADKEKLAALGYLQ